MGDELFRRFGRPSAVIRALSAACIAAAVLASTPARAQIMEPAGATAAVARSDWKAHIDRLVKGRAMGVAVHIDGRSVYRHRERVERVPASTQKLFLSMALLEEFEPDLTLPTFAAGNLRRGVVIGDLWLVGRGDPTLSTGGPHTRALPLPATRIGRLARKLVDLGVRRVAGGVVGSRSYFAHDWFAPGWKDEFPVLHVGLPSALSYEGNIHDGKYTARPELFAARALTRKLEALGIKVGNEARVGGLPGGLPRLAEVRSAPLKTLLRYTNRKSSNLFAELLGKRLGVQRYGRPGTIARAAAAVSRWIHRNGATAAVFDSSGLSFDNSISPRSTVELIDAAHEKPWANVLRSTLARAGLGTLNDRLAGVAVRAKTGTLEGVSALAGWVRLDSTGRWASFSIMSRGMSKSRAIEIEDEIVRTVARSAP